MDEGQALDAGNAVDFRYIYDATITLLFKIAYRIANDSDVAEDLAHDSLIKASEKGMQFPSINDAKYWLIRVTKNNSLNYVKRKARERKAYNKVLFEHKDKTAKTPDVEYMEGESVVAVQKALSALPDKLREAIILKEYTDLNYKEIGKILGISEGNVKVRIFRARKVLEDLLGGENVFMPND